MGKGLGSLGRTVRIGAFVAGLMLVMGLPSIASAVGVATFSSVSPVPGSTTTVRRPTVSITVHDRYGSYGYYGAAHTATKRMWVNGVNVPMTVTYLTGHTTFRLTYAIPADLPLTSNVVTVKIHDSAGHNSSYSWTFTVAVVGALPSTTRSNDFPVYQIAEVSGIVLTATDVGGPGVAATYFILDNGPTVAGTNVLAHFLVGVHTLEYWSVDTAGNSEAHHHLTGTVAELHTLLAAYQGVTCFQTGCHVGSAAGTTTIDVATIHASVGGCNVCHLSGQPTANCDTVGCHSASDIAHQPINNPHPTHVEIDSTSTPTACTNSGCHTTTLMDPSYIHVHGCSDCHNATDPAVRAIMTTALANDTTVTCEACHFAMDGGAHQSIDAIHNFFHADTSHAVAGACFTSGCHGGDISLMHAAGVDEHGNPAPGCVACHKNATHATTRAPASKNCGDCHADVSTIHNFTHTNATGTKSSACVACHGSDLPTAHNGVYTGNNGGTNADLGCFCHFTGYLASEMAPLVQANAAECTDCHKNAHAAHGFSVTPTGTITATMPIVSGHNTTTYGTVGAYSKFDGSQGQGVLLKDSTGATVTTTWGLPTVNVFWSQDPSATVDAPAGANTTVGWNSVITCQDCHTGLNAAGPHGASDNWGIDTNYPYPYADAVNSHLFMSGIAARTTTDVANPGLSGSNTGAYPTTSTPTNWTGTVAVEAAHGLVDGGQAGTSYAVICSKCHKLFDYNSASQGVVAANSLTHGPVWAVNTGVNNDSNDAHASHHWDLNNGAADCTNCHVAIPHGWIRPRLLVNGVGTPTTIASHAGTATYTVTVPTTHVVTWTSDLYPFWQGRGVGASHLGMGPLSASDNHTLNATGGAPWTESNCIACGQHTGVTTDVGKLK